MFDGNTFSNIEMSWHNRMNTTKIEKQVVLCGTVKDLLQSTKDSVHIFWIHMPTVAVKSLHLKVLDNCK
jgi:hypothetical protein